MSKVELLISAPSKSNPLFPYLQRTELYGSNLGKRTNEGRQRPEKLDKKMSFNEKNKERGRDKNERGRKREKEGRDNVSKKKEKRKGRKRKIGSK